MYLAYFDESGDSGLVNSPTKYFVLGALLVHQNDWLSTLDELITIRRKLKQQHGISPRPEIKSTDIRRGRGALKTLRWSLQRRMLLYRNLLRYVATNFGGAHVFAVAIDKAKCAAKGRDPRATAWEFAIQRLDRFCREYDEKIMVFPDEGHGVLIKRLMRRMRRYHVVPKRWGQGTFAIPTQRVIEDPNDRASHDSYYIQLADWLAYAAHRSTYVDPQPGVDPTLWDQLGPRLLRPVNRVTGGPPAIVCWP